MEKQHLKRLGYGFSALVMTLSAVTFTPGNFASATSACTGEATTISALAGTVDTICLSDHIAADAAIAINDTAELDLNGYTITKGETPVFNVAADKTLTIVGTGSIEGLTALADLNSGNGNVVIKGGTYGVNPTAKVGAGFTAYPNSETEPTAWTVKATVVYTPTVLITQPTWKRTFKTNRELTIGTYNVVEVNDVELAPTVVVKHDTAAGEIVSEEDFAVVTSDGNVKVTALAEGTYYITVTDGTETATNLILKAYTIDAENTIDGKAYEVAVGDVLDLADDLDASFVNAFVPGYNVTGDDGLMTRDGLKFTADTAGTAELSFALLDMDNNTSLIATVEIYDDSDAEKYMSVDDSFTTAAYGTNWAVAESANTSVAEVSISTEEATAGQVTITAKSVGETTITLKSSDAEDAIEKEITVGVYDIETSKVLETTDNRLDMTTLAELPDGYTVEIAAADAVEDFVSYVPATKLATPETVGERTFTYQVKNANGDDAGAPVNVTIYVKGADVEIADRYVKVGADDTAALEDLYTLTGDGTTLAVTVDGEAYDETEAFTSNEVGEHTVVFTELKDGNTIAEQEVTFYVYGVTLENQVVFVGEETTVTLDTYGVTAITDMIPSSTTKLNVEEAGDGIYTITASEKGDYTVSFKVTEREGADVTRENVEYGPFTITAYEKLDVTVVDDEIDINPDLEEEDAALFTLTSDADTVVTVEVEEDAPITAVYDADLGAYVVELAEDAEVEAGDTFDITVSQKLTLLDEEAIAEDVVTITIVDSTEPAVVYTIEADEYADEITAGDEVTLTFTTNGTPTVTVTKEGEAEGAEATVAAGDTEGSYTATYTFAEAGSYNVTFTIAEDAEVSDQMALTVNEAVAEVVITVDEENSASSITAGDLDGGTIFFTYEGVELDDITVKVLDEDGDEVTSYFGGLTPIADEETEGGAMVNIFTGNVFMGGADYTVVISAGDVSAEHTVTLAEPEQGEITGESSADLEAAFEAINAAWAEYFELLNGGTATDEELEAAENKANALIEKYFDGITFVDDDGEEHTIPSWWTLATVESALNNGVNVTAELVKTEQTEDEVGAEAVAAIRQAVLDEFGDTSVLDNIMYYDIDVVLTAEDGTVLGTMHQVDNAKTIVIENLAGAADGYTRNYIVIRYHDGVAEIIESSYDADAGTVTFDSDKFSTYALAYQDTLKAVADTGAATSEGASATTSTAAAVVTLAAIITLAGAVKFAKSARK